MAVNLSEDLPPVPADHDGLQQVLLNLVNNSVDAMPEGGWLEITTRRDEAGRCVGVISISDIARADSRAQAGHVLYAIAQRQTSGPSPGPVKTPL